MKNAHCTILFTFKQIHSPFARAQTQARIHAKIINNSLHRQEMHHQFTCTHTVTRTQTLAHYIQYYANKTVCTLHTAQCQSVLFNHIHRFLKLYCCCCCCYCYFVCSFNDWKLNSIQRIFFSIALSRLLSFSLSVALSHSLSLYLFVTVCLECEIICARALAILFLSIQINIFKRVGVYLSKRVVDFFFIIIVLYRVNIEPNTIISNQITHSNWFFPSSLFCSFLIFCLQQQQCRTVGLVKSWKPSRKNNNINITCEAATTI